MRFVRICGLIAVILLAASPALAVVDRFNATADAQGNVTGGGSGYPNPPTGTAEGEWYLYPSGWSNQWFNNAPFDPHRMKVVNLDFEVSPTTPGAVGIFSLALNWATPAWSLQVPPLDRPPLPQDFQPGGPPEDLYIGRRLVTRRDIVQTEHLRYDLVIPWYNPEWVSIDIAGANFALNGVIDHRCVVPVPSAAWAGVVLLGGLCAWRRARSGKGLQ